jgi:KTSC domain-containing protein
MKMQPVTSRALSAIGYDPATKQMKVQFKSGGTYLHSNVSPADHEALMGSASKGKHYRYIAAKFSVTKVNS